MTPIVIAITGASGMIGQALTRSLRAAGHTVRPISRRLVAHGILWDPARGRLDPGDLDGVTAVVHLAGENIGASRWTAARKARLRDSRLGPTRLLADTLARLSQPPAVLISASAVGIYGDRGDEELDEHSTLGADFLATLAAEWETAADPARAAGIRVVHPRFGVVLSPTGGALARLLPPYRLGLGGPVGSGKQWLPWIALADVEGMIAHLIHSSRLVGAVNGVAPQQVTNAEFGRTLARVVHRPAVIPLPALALRLLLGEMADATILASQRVVSSVLKQSNYRWRFPTLEAALNDVI